MNRYLCIDYTAGDADEEPSDYEPLAARLGARLEEVLRVNRDLQEERTRLRQAAVALLEALEGRPGLIGTSVAQLRAALGAAEDQDVPF